MEQFFPCLYMPRHLVDLIGIDLAVWSLYVLSSLSTVGAIAW